MTKKKKIKLPPKNQLENLKEWIKFFENYEKLPHPEVFCGTCKKNRISLSNYVLKKKLTESKIEEILISMKCKHCKDFEKAEEKLKKKKESSDIETPKTTHFLTREEIEERGEKIRKTLPKIEVRRNITVIDLRKNKEACEYETRDTCIRPDIFLKNRDCDDCGINKWCKCPIKKFSKNYKG